MFLDKFLAGTSITFGVKWTPAPGNVITGANLSLRHENTGTIVNVVGVADVSNGADAYKATAILNDGGRWNVRWTTVPPGGVTDDHIYIEP